jgi:hypothetical protein
VTYSYRTEYVEKEQLPTTPQIGLIAQDIEKLVPEVIEFDRDGIRSINYDLLVPVLIEAIKEQQSEIEKLKKQINN